MFETITPEQSGISSANILEFMQSLDRYGLATHSMIMARGNQIFHECYYAPFHKDFKHRMYSVSKSFVSVAIGLLIEDGVLSLDDKFIDFFPEYLNQNTNDKLRELTIRDMLIMETGDYDGVYWFTAGTEDRTSVYFMKPAEKIPGTIFNYDSPASYMLGVIAEKLAGKPFLEFLKERFLLDIGFSADAYCLKAPGGYSFSDSGVMCTARDLLAFARFVMNKGTWNGKRYMNKQFLTDAVSKQVDNRNNGTACYNTCGYGYQIWKTQNDGFSFNGMGGQFAVCDPKTDFIFIINSDNQGNEAASHILFHELYRCIINNLNSSMPENPQFQMNLKEYSDTRKLAALGGRTQNPFSKTVEDVIYYLESNPMGIEYIRFNFKKTRGILTYKNSQGEKQLFFGLGYNEFGKFPQEGYSDMTATQTSPGNMYDCACSAVWGEEQKLLIKVQIIDKYFGNLTMTFGFKDSRIEICMIKNAEAFLEEYSGFACGKIAAQ